MLKLLGMLDLSVALFFILAQWDIGLGIATVLGVIFLIKSLIFITDWVSVIDIFSGVYLFFVIYDVHSSLSLIFIIWLMQKGIFSLIV